MHQFLPYRIFSIKMEIYERVISNIIKLNSRTKSLGGQKLNFQYLTIDISCDLHSFDSYRKLMCTDVTTASLSIPHEHTTIHALIHRLIFVPRTPESFREEANTINTYIAASTSMLPFAKNQSPSMRLTAAHPSNAYLSNKKKSTFVSPI